MSLLVESREIPLLATAARKRGYRVYLETPLERSADTAKSCIKTTARESFLTF